MAEWPQERKGITAKIPGTCPCVLCIFLLKHRILKGQAEFWSSLGACGQWHTAVEEDIIKVKHLGTKHVVKKTKTKQKPSQKTKPKAPQNDHTIKENKYKQLCICSVKFTRYPQETGLCQAPKCLRLILPDNSQPSVNVLLFSTSLIPFPSSAKKPGTVSLLLFVEKWLILGHAFPFQFPFEWNRSVRGTKSKQGAHKLLQSSSPFIAGIKPSKWRWNSHQLLEVLIKAKGGRQQSRTKQPCWYLPPEAMLLMFP